MGNLCLLTAAAIFLSVTTSAQLTRAHRQPTSRPVPQYLRSPNSQRALLSPDQQALRRAASSSDISWVQCPPEAQDLGAMCGTLPVLLDRPHPEGKKIDIYFELYLHTNPGPAESALLGNAGGPGIGTTGLRVIALILFVQNLDVHDILLIDDRGSGLSATIDCEELQHATAHFDRSEADCAAQLGAADSWYGTGDMAMDTDAVRAALGYDKVDYLGSSYGGADVTGGEYEFSPATQVLPKAKAAAQKAMELDDTLAEAHAALAYAEFFDWDWLNVEREFKRAIELNPNNAPSHRRYGETLQARARFSEALAEGMRAQELDPLSPDIVANLGFTHLMMQHYDESIAQFRKVLDLKSNVPVAHAFTAVAYAKKGMHRQALAEYDQISDRDKAVAPETQLIADTLGWVYAVSGRRADALKIALEFRQLSTHAYVDSYQLGMIYAGLDEKDEAFRLLEKAYDQHSPDIVFLAVDPFWYGMRSDPRFADLLRRIGLPKPE
jgi:tetratricopeptide (TPR) repeat protein